MPNKLPPQNIEAERSILGALLIDKDAIIKVTEFLRPSHFYHSHHGDIYTAILNLYERRQPADMVTVTDELDKLGVLEKIGGAGYLTDLVNAVPTSAHVEHYGNIVYAMSTKRELISTCSKIAQMGFEEGREVSELLDEAERAIFAVSYKRSGTAFERVTETLEVAFDRLDELHKNPGQIRGVPTGFKSLDDKLAGLQNSNLIILAARPSVGKTSLAINIAQYAATDKKIPVGIFSLETSREQLVYRMLASQADVDGWRLATGRLEEEDFKKIGEAMGQLAEAPIYIDDTPGIGVMEMRTKARKLQMEHDIRLIIVDYLQLAHARKLESRVQEVTEISQALKNLARELDIPVLAASQLSRAIETRGERRPQLSDLRESGSIEQDADVVMFLYRQEEDDRENIKLLIAKHRNGPTGEIDLYFRGERTRFYEADKIREAK